MNKNQVWKYGVLIGRVLCLSLLTVGFVEAVQAAEGVDSPRYVIHGDTVYDKQTDLTWARCSIGQKWKEGVGCDGRVKGITHDEISSYESNYEKQRTQDVPLLASFITHDEMANYARRPDPQRTCNICVIPKEESGKYWNDMKSGSKGWRLPTKDELITLIDYTRKSKSKSPVIDVVAFPGMDVTNLGYWTSTSNGTSSAWIVGFYVGVTYDYNFLSADTLSLRLVRSGK